MEYFTADEHFDHRNIITHCKRPFKHKDEMNEQLVLRHNSVVTDNDKVYHLGDMFWRSFGTAAFGVMNNLNGEHFYIPGNHEEIFSNWPELRSFFGWTKAVAELEIPGYPLIVLCHYAMRVWPRSHKGSWQLYGHSHGELPKVGLSLDVGVDCWDFTPVSIVQIANAVERSHQ